MQERKNVTKIKGISQIRRLPRLGKIRLGVKVKKKEKDKRCTHDAKELCFYCSYPKETEYFIVPPEVQKVYGEKPTELDVMLPTNDENVFFAQAYKYYGASRGVKCYGDGETGYESTDDGIKEHTCPCKLLDQKKCSMRAHLLVILPRVNLGGVYQIDTGSYHSIVDINSGIDYVRTLVHIATQGRTDNIALLPLTLIRAQRTTYEQGKSTHYTMKLLAPPSIDNLCIPSQTAKFLLPSPEDINPELDNGVVVPENGDTEREATNVEEEKGTPEGSMEWYYEQANGFNNKDEFEQWMHDNAMVIKTWEDDDQSAFRKHCATVLKKLIGAKTANV